MKGYKMKKILFTLAAVAMMSSPSYASKARMTALANSASITDTQSIFVNAADVNYVAEFATFEMGTPNATDVLTQSGTTPEGGFLQSTGDAKWGFYLGRVNKTTNSARIASGPIASGLTTSAGSMTFLPQENPFDVYYGSKMGDMAWGVDFNYSASNKQVTSASTDDQKQNAMGLGLGVKTDVWGAYANVGLGSTAQNDKMKYNGTQGLVIGGHYLMGPMKFFIKESMFGFNVADNTATKVYESSTAETTLGMTNTWKQDANRVFYGIAYQITNSKSKTGTAADVKSDTAALPVHVGMEVDAASWLILRGSIAQNVLLGSKKVATVTDSIAHNTKTAAGAGLKFGKNTIDFAMNMGSSGTLAFDSLGAQAAYTYLF
jgi:hypothetical protein